MIHLNIFINAVIIIGILHLLIVHFDREKRGHPSSDLFMRTKAHKSDNSMPPFGDRRSSKREHFSQNADLEYLSVQDPEPEPKQKINTITPSNTYDAMDYLNKPNFDSNVLDYTKFYKINQPSTPTTNPSTPKNSPLIPSTTPLPSIISPRPLDAVANSGKVPSRPSRQLPDRWEYANELPMNGGMFGSIVGLDSMSMYESLSPYDGGSIHLKKCGEEVVARIPHNDLRKPIVVN